MLCAIGHYLYWRGRNTDDYLHLHLHNKTRDIRRRNMDSIFCLSATLHATDWQTGGQSFDRQDRACITSRGEKKRKLNNVNWTTW